MQEWVSKNGLDDGKALLDYAYALATHYGEAIGALACQMYEETAAAQNVTVAAAEAAATPEYGEVAKAVNGAKKQSEKLISSTVGRLVKQVGADTTLKNAQRDGAQFAWIPHGDTCAFCLALASRGWQYMSKSTLKNGHAEHIHANCDCEYAIRFDGSSTVEGYDPDKYLEMYNNAEGNTPQEKINSMRRTIAAQKKAETQKYSYEDITEKILDATKPGTGQLIFEQGTGESEQETAEWLHKTLGGDITCLAERPSEGKMPDAIWNGTYYEFKAPTSKTAIDDRIRKAEKQLYEVLEREGNDSGARGMIIDISQNKLAQNEAIEEIIQRSVTRCKGPTTVLVKNKDELVKAISIK